MVAVQLHAPYFSKKWSMWPCARIVLTGMTAKPCARIDGGRTIVGTGLADVVVGDGLYFGAIPIAILGQYSSTRTKLA